MSREPIFITGVGKRLGLQLALNYLGRGCHVIGTYRSERPSLAELRNKGAELYQCDFSIPTQIQRLITSITARHQSLRALIHNASDWLADDHGIPGAEIDRKSVV